MARVAVTVEDLEAGTLPGICAKTGEQADGFATIEFTSTPQWTWILLLFGILPFVIARAFSKVRVVGLVPMSDAALRRARLFTWAYAGLFVLGIVLIVFAVALRSTTPAAIGVLMLVAALLVMVIGWPIVWPMGKLNEDVVWLWSVDRRFVDVVDRYYNPPVE
jgi:hypothetical protein